MKATLPASLSSTCEESVVFWALEHNNQRPSVHWFHVTSASKGVASSTGQQNNIQLKEGIKSIVSPTGDSVFSFELLAGALGEYR